MTITGVYKLANQFLPEQNNNWYLTSTSNTSSYQNYTVAFNPTYATYSSAGPSVDPYSPKYKLASKLYKLYSKVLLEEEDYTEWLDSELGSTLDILLFED